MNYTAQGYILFTNKMYIKLKAICKYYSKIFLKLYSVYFLLLVMHIGVFVTFDIF